MFPGCPYLYSSYMSWAYRVDVYSLIYQFLGKVYRLLRL